MALEAYVDAVATLVEAGWTLNTASPGRALLN